jgi:hypothetical protein
VCVEDVGTDDVGARIETRVEGVGRSVGRGVGRGDVDAVGGGGIGGRIADVGARIAGSVCSGVVHVEVRVTNVGRRLGAKVCRAIHGC